MSKRAYVAFLKEAASLVGADAARVKGHSGRISGARRLARRGLVIGAIQVFCRWGGRTVLHYLQEAALVSQETVLAKGKERLGTVDLQAQVDALLSKSIQDKKVLSLVTTAVTGELAEQFWAKPVGSEDCSNKLPSWANDLSRRVDEVSLDLGLLAGVVEPRYIKSTSDRGGRGKAHAVITKGKTICGWEFKGKQWTPLPAACWFSPPAGLKRCDTCLGSG